MSYQYLVCVFALRLASEATIKALSEWSVYKISVSYLMCGDAQLHVINSTNSVLNWTQIRPTEATPLLIITATPSNDNFWFHPQSSISVLSIFVSDVEKIKVVLGLNSDRIESPNSPGFQRCLTLCKKLPASFISTAHERMKRKFQLMRIQIKTVSSLWKDGEFYTRLNLTLYHYSEYNSLWSSCHLEPMAHSCVNAQS